MDEKKPQNAIVAIDGGDWLIWRPGQDVNIKLGYYKKKLRYGYEWWSCHGEW